MIMDGDKMRALITGASSGIGKYMAIYLSQLGYDLIIVARNKKKLQELKDSIKTDVKIYDYDLSNTDNCYKLYNSVKGDIDIVINNAGFGLFEEYSYDNLDEEINMIDLNIKCLHILTKLFVNDKNVKYILNVASSAGLLPGGPLMSTYYATKSYVCSYTLALYEELRRNKSKKGISVLCPGPVNTDFNNRANVNFKISGLSPKYVSKYAIDMMFKKKLIIIPGFSVRMGLCFMKFLPTKTLLKLIYGFQERKKHR